MSNLNAAVVNRMLNYASNELVFNFQHNRYAFYGSDVESNKLIFLVELYALINQRMNGNSVLFGRKEAMRFFEENDSYDIVQSFKCHMLFNFTYPRLQANAALKGYSTRLYYLGGEDYHEYGHFGMLSDKHGLSKAIDVSFEQKPAPKHIDCFNH